MVELKPNGLRRSKELLKMSGQAIGKRTIALVEDDDILLNLLAKKLAKSGYDVKAARDGASALDLIKETKPDLVLLDMMLPKMNGFAVLEKLNKEKILPGLPVVVISNSGETIELERAKKLGARDHLIKVNFDANDVLDIVRRVLRQKADSAGGAGGSGQPPKNKESSLGSVLIVEDDSFLVDLLERKFEKLGYKTRRAADARQARDILEKESVDAILLDIVLPGMDGITFLKEIKSQDKHRDKPVVVVSNLGQQEEKEKGIKAGAADYFIKAHVTPGEIARKVIELIKKGQKAI